MKSKTTLHWSLLAALELGLFILTLLVFAWVSAHAAELPKPLKRTSGLRLSPALCIEARGFITGLAIAFKKIL